MTLTTISIFIVGVMVGALGGWLLARRSTIRLFTGGDTGESGELRGEAIKSVNLRIAKRKERIMERAREAGRVTNNDVEDLYCISDRTASEYLRQLTKEGKLIRHGAGRGTYYVPVKSASEQVI